MCYPKKKISRPKESVCASFAQTDTGTAHLQAFVKRVGAQHDVISCAESAWHRHCISFTGPRFRSHEVHPMFAIHRILYPADFSELSRPAFELACSLARDYDARLVACHVVPPPVPAVVEGVALDVDSDDRGRMQAQLDQLTPNDPSIAFTRRLESGDPVRELLRVAKEEAVDLIVTGTHGRSGFSRLLMGSVAEGLMRGATCPVMTVKASTSEKA